MRTRLATLIAAAGICAALALPNITAQACTLQLAQADLRPQMGPSRSPNVVIEEPRPSRPAIETEGRGERRNCHPITVTEWQDGVKTTRTEEQCER